MYQNSPNLNLKVICFQFDPKTIKPCAIKDCSCSVLRVGLIDVLQKGFGRVQLEKRPLTFALPGCWHQSRQALASVEEEPGSLRGHSRSQQADHRTASETDVWRITPHKRILLLQWTVTLPNRVRWLRACSGDWLRSALCVLVGSTEGTFFFSFFFAWPAEVCLSTSQPGSGAFYWGNAEVMLGFTLQTERVFGFHLNRVILKTATIRGEKLVCSFF